MTLDGTGLAATSDLDGPADLEQAQVPALALQGIVKRWKGVSVLEGADLEVPRGTRAFVGGYNGVGKTTLLRIAAGMLIPDAGTVSLLGLDPERQRRAYHKKLGFLSAGNSGLYARLSVRDNLKFVSAIGFIPRARRCSVIDAALERFRLVDLASRRADRLSMGQRQRVRLAITFLHGPEVVLLDEPHTSLDDKSLALLGDVLDEHVRAGGSAMIVAPSREHVALGCDVSYVVDAGRVVAA